MKTVVLLSLLLLTLICSMDMNLLMTDPSQGTLVSFSWSPYSDPHARELILYGDTSALDTSVVTATVIIHSITPEDTTVAVTLPSGDYWGYLRAKGSTKYSDLSNIIYYAVPLPVVVTLDSVLNVRVTWEPE